MIHPTLLKAKAKDYEDGTIVTSEVSNLIHYSDPFWNDIFNIPDIGFAFHHFNKQALVDLWGKPTFTWTGEFRFSCWYLDLQGKGRILFLGAKVKGVCCEIVTSVNDKAIPQDLEVVKAFIKQTIKQIVEWNKAHGTNWDSPKSHTRKTK